MRRRRLISAAGRFGFGSGAGPGVPPDPDQGTYYVLADDDDATLIDDGDADLTSEPWLP